LPISHDRIVADFSAIAACTSTPGQGASRPTFSDTWRAACDYVRKELESIGCEVRVDCLGNIHARPKVLGWEVPAWLSGSHLDSVPNGGDYDGVAGVVVPLELLRAAHEDGITDLPLELIIFAEEEGTTFGLGLLGSRAWVGNLSAEDLARIFNDEGQNYLDAGSPCGVNPERIGQERLDRERYLGFVEVHPEQGPGMWNDAVSVAVVNAIAGRRQYKVRVLGRANHAGSTAMKDRLDAMAGASEMITSLEALAIELPYQSVITVGRLFMRPNAINVIPGEVDFTIDFRSPDNDVLELGEERLQKLVMDIAQRRGLSATLITTETLPAVSLDADLCTRLGKAVQRAGKTPTPEKASGALHDAAVVAPYLPTAMLFVASKDGISHNADEFSRTEDVALAAEILNQLARG
jgi:allantoate deiminase